MRINAFCEDKGWLFNDIQSSLISLGAEGSSYPLSGYDAWICIRSSELRKSPDLARTVVQVHNMEPHDIDLFNRCLGVIFTHPMQHWLWKREGFKGTHIMRPIGTREVISPPSSIPDKPTVGFFCGENKQRWKGSDIFQSVVRKARRDIDFECLLVGRGLEHISELGRYEKHAATPEDYARIDVLFCASQSPGIPLSLYEACAAGKVVVSTPRWFIDTTPANVRIAETVQKLTSRLIVSLQHRQKNFDRREKLAWSPFTYEGWIDANIRFTDRWLNRMAQYTLGVR